jgi:hypothetical protein
MRKVTAPGPAPRFDEMDELLSGCAVIAVGMMFFLGQLGAPPGL